MDRVLQRLMNVLQPYMQSTLTNLDKIQDSPWRLFLGFITASFVVVSALTTVVAELMLPKVEDSLIVKSAIPFKINKEKPTLNDDDVISIITRNIFNIDGKVGDESDNAQNKNIGADEVIKSTLPLKLIGTIYGGDAKTGLAVIEDNSTHNQNSFMVGDLVTRDATLSEVLKQRVILQVAGHREYIEMENQEIPLTRRRKGRKTSSSSSQEAAVGSANEFKEEGFERAGTKIVMSPEYRTKLLTVDFAKVLQDAKAEPVYENGELAGFKLNRIRKDSIYEKAGLQNEDIVKEISGTSLTDTAQAIRLLNSLRAEPEIEIRVLRGGSPVTVNMQVK